MSCGQIYRDKKPTVGFYDPHKAEHVEGLRDCHCSAGHDAIRPIDEINPRDIHTIIGGETTQLQKEAGLRQGDATSDRIAEQRKELFGGKTKEPEEDLSLPVLAEEGKIEPTEEELKQEEVIEEKTLQEPEPVIEPVHPVVEPPIENQELKLESVNKEEDRVV
jgi:hypothetical protein